MGERACLAQYVHRKCGICESVCARVCVHVCTKVHLCHSSVHLKVCLYGCTCAKSLPMSLCGRAGVWKCTGEGRGGIPVSVTLPL